MDRSLFDPRHFLSSVPQSLLSRLPEDLLNIICPYLATRLMQGNGRFLIVGGNGFVGRHLVRYLYEHNLASFVCVAEKIPYMIASLSAEEMTIYKKDDFLGYQAADMGQPSHVEKAFAKAGGNYDFCINLAAVTKYSQDKAVYLSNIRVTKHVAEAAGKNNVRLIHVSTAQVYKSKTPATEDTIPDPWTEIAIAHLEAEKLLRSIPNLNYVIARPATIYGTADQLGLTPRMICAALHKELNQKMECLYTKDLRWNTVHVDDVAKALVFLSFIRGEQNGEIYNLADKNDTDQGKLNECWEEMFGIQTSYVHWMKMAAASALGKKFLVDFVNDAHLKPFSDACKKYGISNTPLTPYLDEELLGNQGVAVDGSKIEKLGFSYRYPKLKTDALKEVLDDFVTKGFFPKEMSYN